MTIAIANRTCAVASIDADVDACTHPGQHTVTLRDGVVEAGEFIEYDSLSYSLCSTHLNTHLSHLAKRAAETGYTLSVE